MTNLDVHARLALGSAQFGSLYGIKNKHGQLEPEEVREIVLFARDSGLDTIDTAVNYGDSERLLGEAGVSDWKIVTKLPAFPQDHPDLTLWANEQLDLSLQDLKITKVDAVLLHEPEQLISGMGDEIYGALQSLKEDNKASKVGISIYSPDELEQIIPVYPLDIIQTPLNIIDQRLISSGWLERLARNHIEIHTRSVFLQGLLLMSAEARPGKFDRWNSLWKKWHAYLLENNLNPVHVCLSYVLSVAEISRVVVGIDELLQLKQILQYAANPLDINANEFICEDEELINPSRWSEL